MALYAQNKPLQDIWHFAIVGKSIKEHAPSSGWFLNNVQKDNGYNLSGRVALVSIMAYHVWSSFAQPLRRTISPLLYLWLLFIISHDYCCLLTGHNMRSWNLTSKKFSTETEYGVLKKCDSVAPVRKIAKPHFRK